MAEVTIEATPNGPYLVTGPIELRDADGKALPIKSKIWLCRCGASTRKPFCDGNPLQDRLPGRGAGGARVGRGGLTVDGPTTARRGTDWSER
jgi:3-phenylpropionate/trans-cinnamate dioxygenase ferredoxin subunit